MNLRTGTSWLAIAAGALAAAACSDGGESGPGGNAADSGATGTDGGPDIDGGGGDGVRYLLHSAVSTADNRTNYFTVVDSLAQGELSYDQSLELPGRARLYAQPGNDSFAIGDAEDLSLTRYELASDGSLVAGDSVSLQPFGVSSLGAQAVQFVSPTKAYYKDSTQAQIIVWNPEQMAVEEAIELPAELIKDGYITSMSDWVSREGEAYFAVSWYTEQYDQVLEGTSLVRIDTETDEVTVTEDSRCRGIVTTSNVAGTLYFFSDVINGFGHNVYPDEGGQQDCVLRITEGETAFDPDWVGTLSAGLPDSRAGAAMEVTAGGEVWLQAVDLSVAPSEPGSTYGEWYGAGWTWWRTSIDALDSAEEIEGEPGAYSGFIFPAESGFYVSQTASDYSETTLLEVSTGTPAAGISFPGFTLDVVRVQ